MKEIQDIITKIQNLPPQKAVLATVVNIKGSTYRRPGARMLITSTGEIIGAISGGCLEEDVKKRSRAILQNNHKEVITYDMMSDDDIVWGLGLGCNGIIQVLVECISTDTVPKELQFALECYEREEAGFIATVFASTATTNIGKKYLFRGNNPCKTWQEILDFLPQMPKKTRIIELPLAGEKSQVLVETIVPTTMIIFGAGFDALPLANLSKNLGWKVIVCDARETYLNKERFPNVDVRIVTHPKNIREHLRFHNNQYVVVMTHNYYNDLEVLAQLRQAPVAYIGMLGPKSRTERILDEIQSNEKLEIPNLYGPIGLDIGSETPEEIATAIISEILAVKNKRAGGHLKFYDGSIH